MKKNLLIAIILIAIVALGLAVSGYLAASRTRIKSAEVKKSTDVDKVHELAKPK